MASEQQAQVTKYIDLILQVGLNIQKGQRLLVAGSLLYGIDVALAPFVRQLATAAYAHGASYVDVVWGDPLLDLVRLQAAPAETLSQYPKWPAAARLEHVEAGDAMLSVHADDPDLLAGVDPKLVATQINAIRAGVQPAAQYLFRNSTNWCVVAAPLPAWAAKVLPDVPAAEQEERLWQMIFTTCRVDTPDPVASWRKHIADLTGRAAYLTHKQYAAVTYSGPGTRLKVGLPAGHIWNGGQTVSGNGITFVANLPTEEVFTLPDRAAVEGHLTSTRPFIYGGTTIDGMSLAFKEGKVVDFSARSGETILRELLATDEGSSRLGEVSLVPNSSPISRLGVTMHSVLFDENASSHLAFGNAYRFSLKDADGLSAEEFAQRGGNTSKVHSDFMIGSAELDIDGVLPDGKTEPVMRAGEWAF